MRMKENTNWEVLRTGEVRRALFDNTEKYRYSLSITWDESLPAVQFIGLNPSTADENKDDPTVAKLKRLSRRLDYGAMHMTNLFSMRATHPADMRAAKDPGCGEEEDRLLLATAEVSSIVVACWGVNGEHQGRGTEVLRLLKPFEEKLRVFNLTKDGHPQHPLYLPDDLDPRRAELSELV